MCWYMIMDGYFYARKVFETGRSIWASNGEEREVGTRDFIEILKHLEEALGEKNYFGGDAFGYLDIIAIPHSAWFLAYEKLGGFKVADHAPKISAWVKRSLQRESVSKVLPDPEKVYQFVLHFRKMSGLDWWSMNAWFASWQWMVLPCSWFFSLY